MIDLKRLRKEKGITQKELAQLHVGRALLPT